MEKKKWSRAFESYMQNFVDVLNEAPENKVLDNGKREFYFANFETHRAKDSLYKESTFELKGAPDETVKFKINQVGTFVGAEYVDFSDYKSSNSVHSQYVGKDFEKLEKSVKSEELLGILKKFDWTKEAEKEGDLELAGC